MGVGKSSVSWALLDLMQDTVLLEGDYLTAYSDYDYRNDTQVLETFELVSRIIGFHLVRGKKHFVINWVFENPEVLEQLVEALKAHPLPIKVFRLDSSIETLTQRIKRRNLENLAHELRRGPELKGILDQWGSQLGHIIDTNNLAPREVANTILHLSRVPPTP